VKAYSYSKFRKAVKKADVVYGSVSLNASCNVPVRIKKGALLTYLDLIDKDSPQRQNPIYATSTKSDKGLRVLRLV